MYVFLTYEWWWDNVGYTISILLHKNKSGMKKSNWTVIKFEENLFSVTWYDFNVENSVGNYSQQFSQHKRFNNCFLLQLHTAQRTEQCFRSGSVYSHVFVSLHSENFEINILILITWNMEAKLRGKYFQLKRLVLI